MKKYNQLKQTLREQNEDMISDECDMSYYNGVSEQLYELEKLPIIQEYDEFQRD